MASYLTPLHGTKTHPLSAAAIDVLERLKRGPIPAQQINPGVVNRLMREGCVEFADLPSPYPSHRGRRIQHLRIREVVP